MKFIFLILSVLSSLWTEPVQEYSYLQDISGDLNIERVRELNFTRSSDNNLGTENGSYWLRIDKNPKNRSILEIKNANVQDLALYDANGKSIEILPNTRFPSFLLEKQHIKYPLYLKATFTLNAYFPIEISTEEAYVRSEKLGLLASGLFYGTTLALILATLIFSLIFRKKSFLFLSILVFSVALSITGRDSIFNFFNASPIVMQTLESLGHLLIGLSIVGFIIEVIKIDKESSYLKNAIILLSIISTISWLIYAATGNVWSFLLVDCTAMTVYLILGASITKLENVYLRHTVVVFYIVDLLLLLNVSILHTLGLEFITVTVVMISVVAILNFTLIAVYLLISLKNIQASRVRNQQKIEQYIGKIKELDSYKSMLEADDEYMESLIYKFNLENIEVKILSEISKNQSNTYITDKYGLTEERLQTITNTLFEKLGLDKSQDLSQLALP